MFKRWFGKTVYVVVGYWLEDLVKHSVAVFEDKQAAEDYKAHIQRDRLSSLTDRPAYDIVKIIETKVR